MTGCNPVGELMLGARKLGQNLWLVDLTGATIIQRVHADQIEYDDQYRWFIVHTLVGDGCVRSTPDGWELHAAPSVADEIFRSTKTQPQREPT
jgi:hypothetical protein